MINFARSLIGQRGMADTRSACVRRAPASKMLLRPAVLALALAHDSMAATTHWPWFNTSLPREARLRALVAAMTPEELVTQLVKYSQRIDRLGVPQYAWHMEAAHGVAAPGNVTSFPCSLARAAAFDPRVEELIGRATGEEARAKWNLYRQQHHDETPPYHSQGISLTTYAPEVNLCRSACSNAFRGWRRLLQLARHCLLRARSD